MRRPTYANEQMQPIAPAARPSIFWFFFSCFAVAFAGYGVLLLLALFGVALPPFLTQLLPPKAPEVCKWEGLQMDCAEVARRDAQAQTAQAFPPTPDPALTLPTLPAHTHQAQPTTAATFHVERGGTMVQATAVPQPTAPPRIADIQSEADMAVIANLTDLANGGNPAVPSPDWSQPLPTVEVKPVAPIDESNPAAVQLLEQALRNSGVNVDATKTAEAIANAVDMAAGGQP